MDGRNIGCPLIELEGAGDTACGREGSEVVRQFGVYSIVR